MIGMRAMAVGCHNTAHHAVVERKGPEMSGDQDNRESLAFIGAESLSTVY